MHMACVSCDATGVGRVCSGSSGPLPKRFDHPPPLVSSVLNATAVIAAMSASEAK